VTFDDLLAAQRNPKVTDLFVSGRHSSIDTATLCQTLKPGNRTARINASCFWSFNMSEKHCFAELADLLTTESSRARLVNQGPGSARQHHHLPGCPVQRENATSRPGHHPGLPDPRTLALIIVRFPT